MISFLHQSDKRNFLYALITVVLLLLSGCGSVSRTVDEQPEQPEEQPKPEPLPKPKPEPIPDTEPIPIIDPTTIPETPREMRAAWIATVANIDWPSEPGLPVAQQKAELRSLLNRAVQLNLNAVFFQVRPAADALYESSLEPWSEFLTGEQGKAPAPYYDPLAFAVEEAHRRGLELHAWFNPFRAYHFTAKSELAENHIKNTNPGLVVKYGRYWWIDPGQPGGRRHSLNVILDVVKRYNIDGVHLDDYFYPYAEKDRRGRDIPFPDAASYRHYVNENGNMGKGDWRRQNINQFVETLHTEIKKIKPYVLFGISPFGIWRPGNPAQIKGYDAYANIYADARKWFREGWVDYLSPQLYWPVDQQAQSYPVLLKWWEQQNRFDRHLWPGLYTSKVGNSWNANEIRRQIQLTRRQSGASGQVHFSMQALMNNNGDITNELLTHEYRKPALIPATEWLSQNKPPQPQAELQSRGDQWVIQLRPKSGQTPWLWVLKTRYNESWKIEIIPGWHTVKPLTILTSDKKFDGAVLSKVDRLGIESVPQMLLPVLQQVEDLDTP